MDNKTPTEEQTNEVIQGTDPVSGNDIPVGSSAKEVRDDVDAKLSENEYVIPADVVRFYGVNHFEKLISKAKEGYARMVEEGRFGGEEVPEEEDMDDLPFSDEELMYDEEPTAPVEMAEGGSVPEDVPQSSFNPNAYTTGHSTYGGANPFANFGSGIETKIYINASGERRSIMFSNGSPIQAIPEGFMEDTPENRDALASAVQDDSSASVTPLSEDSRAGRGSEDDYGERQVADYASMTPEQREREAKAGAQLSGLVGGLLGGPLGAGAVKGLVRREQRKQMEEQGLSESEIEAALGKAKDGPFSKVGEVLDKLRPNRRPDESYKEAQKAFEEDTRDYWDPERTEERTRDRETFGNDEEGDPDPYSSDIDTTGFSKGGLVKRRGKPKNKKKPGKRGLATRR